MRLTSWIFIVYCYCSNRSITNCGSFESSISQCRCHEGSILNCWSSESSTIMQSWSSESISTIMQGWGSESSSTIMQGGSLERLFWWHKSLSHYFCLCSELHLRIRPSYWFLDSKLLPDLWSPCQLLCVQNFIFEIINFWTLIDVE